MLGTVLFYQRLNKDGDLAVKTTPPKTIGISASPRRSVKPYLLRLKDPKGGFTLITPARTEEGKINYSFCYFALR